MAKEIIGRGWTFPPRIDPRGRLALTSERENIERSISIILSTAPGERVMRPGFGCRLHELVFEPNNSHTVAQARRYVEAALGMWEPRIEVTDVGVRPDTEASDCLLVEVKYEIKASRDPRSLVYPFYLIPEE